MNVVHLKHVWNTYKNNGQFSSNIYFLILENETFKLNYKIFILI